MAERKARTAPDMDALQELDQDELVEWMFLKKQKGNAAFRASQFQKAFNIYQDILVPFKLQMVADSEDLKTEIHCPVMLNIATCLYNLGNFESALQFTNLVALKRGHHSGTYLKKGAILAKLGREDEAREVLRTAQKYASDSATLRSVAKQLEKLDKTRTDDESSRLSKSPPTQTVLYYNQSNFLKRVYKRVKGLCSKLAFRHKIDNLLSYLTLFDDNDD